jgi:hypothetical protein
MHGCYPEELQLEGLRPEQKDFLKNTSLKFFNASNLNNQKNTSK